MPELIRKVIVIGAGNWGKNLVRTFFELNSLIAVVEASSVLRDAISNDFPDIPIYESYCECKTIEHQAVAIATPASTHFQLAEQALLMNKDVFVEKPFTLSTSDAQRLSQLALQGKNILMVGHLLLYQPAIQKLKEFIREGVIGNLHAIHQERLKLGRVRSIENVLWSFGVHDIAVILFLVGSSPINFQISGHRILQTEIEDDVYMHMQFNKNVTAHLHTSWLWPEQRRQLTVIGTKGMLTYNEENQSLVLHKKSIMDDLSNYDEGQIILYQAEEQPLRLECVHFLDCINNRTVPISDGSNGVEVIRILEEASALLKDTN
ncbi:Gfo/Idh/MocA family protein [Cohnella cellulosilytica]|uniref:Gfo/Idh/MocA family protein n=1 Tax=Cohnella cellulosilytica TaxID=986710 RepID=A0ABW2FDG9_9BACL